VETIQNMGLWQLKNSMACLHETIVDGLIHAFMQTTNNNAWLKEGASS
jgi:hypothetical protein